jgi:1-acyl-sn-glycerol-3-phosphate acyltransferase
MLEEVRNASKDILDVLKENKSTTKLGWSLDRRDPKFIQLFMPIWKWLYEYYFRVETSGWYHIPTQQKVLFVGSHNGGFAAPDMFMVMYEWFQQFGVEKPVYGLLHPKVWQVSPLLSLMTAKVGAVVAHPKMAVMALNSGASVLVYPGGVQDVFRPHYQRHKIHLAGRTGFIKLALQENVPIVPVISTGAHDTFLVLANCYEIAKQFHEWGMPWILGIDPEIFPIYLGLPWGVAFGPLPHIPIPVTIRTRVCPPIIFERYGADAARDRDYVNICYEIVSSQMQQELDRLVKSSST